jgi:hypothetical protein
MLVLEQNRHFLAKRQLRPSLGIPIKDAPTGHQNGGERPFQGFETSEEAIDRTPGGLFRRWVDADHEEAVVAPLPRTAQRSAVRFPLVEELIHFPEQYRRLIAPERAIAREHPNPSVVGQVVEIH